MGSGKFYIVHYYGSGNFGLEYGRNYGSITIGHTELLLGLDVPVDLTQVKDDMTDARKGTSFIQRPDNGLLHVYLDLSKQACTTRAGLFKNGKWDWEVVFSYQRKAEDLDEMILGGLYTACVQLPRGPDLLEIECENCSFSERGVYS
jgi:hypothetical protein